MGGLITIGLILAVVAYFLGRVGCAIEIDKEKSNYEEMNNQIDNAINEEDNKARNLVIKTLKEIGCKPEIDDQDNICFAYQGGNFLIDADNNYKVIRIMLPYIYQEDVLNKNQCDIYANYLNNSYRVFKVLTFLDNSDNKCVVHIVADTLIIPDPEFMPYFSSILDTFFSVKSDFCGFMERETSDNRVIVKGFSKN